MKLIACSFILFCSTLLGLCQTWTFHFFQDNCTSAVIYGTPTEQGSWSWTGSAFLDFGWDSAEPESAYSGWEIAVWNGTGYVVESSDLNTTGKYSFDSFGSIYNAWCSISGPYPDYSNFQELYLNTIAGGEFWIDFSSDGILRSSSVLPDDFGKWAWDGSINPSWVEVPLAPVQQGKRLAKGHNK